MPLSVLGVSKSTACEIVQVFAVSKILEDGTFLGGKTGETSDKPNIHSVDTEYKNEVRLREDNKHRY